jgi:hypothetical protein
MEEKPCCIMYLKKEGFDVEAMDAEVVKTLKQ